MGSEFKYYSATKGTKSFEIIDEFFNECDAVNQHRFDLLHRLFPDSKRKDLDFRIASFHGGSWGICFPEGYDIPQVWKKHRVERVWFPKRSTKDGKALSEECAKLNLPSAGNLASRLGVDWTLDGMHLYQIGVKGKFGDRYVIKLHHSQTPPADVTRISDVELEVLVELQNTKVKKPKKRKASNTNG